MKIVYAREFAKEFKKLPVGSVCTASKKIFSEKTGATQGSRSRS
jgi:hypothetical protein